MNPNETVGHRIRLIHNQIHKIMEANRRAEDDDMEPTAMQRWMIGFLVEHEGQDVYQRDIEAAFNISRATASNMLKAMEHRGMIERVCVEYDARLRKIILTPAAKKHQMQAEQAVKNMEERLVRGLSDEQRQTLFYCLDHMLQNLGVDLEEDTRCCGVPYKGQQN